MRLARAPEWISVLAFGGFLILGWRRGLSRVSQTQITLLCAEAMVILIFVSVLLPRWVAPPVASAVRDWTPCLLVPLFYWLAGRFVMRVDEPVETRLRLLDQTWVAPCLEWCGRQPFGFGLFACLELAYFSYYLLLPLAVGALYWLGKERRVDFFWTVVLAAAYGSTGMLALIQTRPPRVIGEKWSAHLPSGKGRVLNLWILRHGSVQANTIPSSHVAISAACALAILAIGPVWAGLIFLALALAIALGAVAGRYHYLADAVLGFLLAAAALLGGMALTACCAAG